MAVVIMTLSACTTVTPIKSVAQVDIDRFMGKWYVIANIPTFIETTAHNATETYALNEDGSIATTFTFRDDGFDGPEKNYHPTGYIEDTNSNAVWGMQFIWPFKAEYRIIYLTPDYDITIIGRSKRDYVWLMARKPVIEKQKLERLYAFIAAQGYDIKKVQMVPQNWRDISTTNTGNKE